MATVVVVNFADLFGKVAVGVEYTAARAMRLEVEEARN